MAYRNKTDNPLFIYTSNNGYSLRDHGLMEKQMLYEEPIHVPFLVDFPGKNDRGVRFDGLISTLDIAPTALNFARISIPDWISISDYTSGRSLKLLFKNTSSEQVTYFLNSDK